MLSFIPHYYTVKEFVIDTSALTFAGILKFLSSQGVGSSTWESNLISFLSTISMVILVVSRCVIVINKAKISINGVKRDELDLEIKKEELKNIKKN